MQRQLTMADTPGSSTPVPAVTPKALSQGEKFLAGVLFVSGIALIVAVLIGFTSDGYTYISKEVTTTEPSGGPKETKEVNYADTVVIFALTLGGALVLTGAFYARIRSLTLGAFKAELGDEEKQKAEDKAEETLRQQVDDPDKQEVLVPAVKQLAVAKAENVAALGVEPTDPLLSVIGAEAAQEVVAATPGVGD